MVIWNPWHGCKKYSEGCQHCYMYALDNHRNIDSSNIKINKGTFDLPVRIRNGSYVIPSGMELFVGLSTDFFIDEADEWRDKCWKMIKQRPDVGFRIITKRADRIAQCLPSDWGDGYNNVTLQVTTENQERADERIPILLNIPAKHKSIFIAPILGPVDITKYLHGLDLVMCGGENYDGARTCDYKWLKSLSDQCKKADVTFNIIETGNRFINEEGNIETLTKVEQSNRALELNLNVKGKPIVYDLISDNIFGIDYTPYFAKCCDNCSSKLTCNGCGKGITCNKNCE